MSAFSFHALLSLENEGGMGVSLSPHFCSREREGERERDAELSYCSVHSITISHKLKICVF